MILSYALINAPAFSYQDGIYYKNWFDEELDEKRKILEAFWQKRIMVYNKKSVDDFREIIIGNHFPKDALWG